MNFSKYQDKQNILHILGEKNKIFKKNLSIRFLIKSLPKFINVQISLLITPSFFGTLFFSWLLESHSSGHPFWSLLKFQTYTGISKSTRPNRTLSSLLSPPPCSSFKLLKSKIEQLSLIPLFPSFPVLIHQILNF